MLEQVERAVTATRRAGARRSRTDRSRLYQFGLVSPAGAARWSAPTATRFPLVALSLEESGTGRAGRGAGAASGSMPPSSARRSERLPGSRCIPCWKNRWSRRCRPARLGRSRGPGIRCRWRHWPAETFILYRRPLGPGLYDAIIAACQRAGYSPNIGQEAPRMLATLSLVAAGLGVTLVPQSMRRLRVHGVIYRAARQRGRARRAAQPGLSPLRDLAGGAAVHGAGTGRRLDRPEASGLSTPG